MYKMKRFHPYLDIYAIHIADVYDMFQGRDTPDISHQLQFSWMQPALYFDPTPKFPSGYFVELAENAGDSLTFIILTANMKNVLTRSVEKPADDFTYRLFC